MKNAIWELADEIIRRYGFENENTVRFVKRCEDYIVGTENIATIFIEYMLLLS